jgi:hypothetical protein
MDQEVEQTLRAVVALLEAQTPTARHRSDALFLRARSQPVTRVIVHAVQPAQPSRWEGVPQRGETCEEGRVVPMTKDLVCQMWLAVAGGEVELAVVRWDRS